MCFQFRCALDPDGLSNTRTTLTSPLISYVMWNMSCAPKRLGLRPLPTPSGRQVGCSHLRAAPPCVGADHSEHHLYTTIPFHALPRAHGLLKDHIVNVSEGHIEVHRQVLSTWMKEQREALVGAAAKKPKAA